MMGRRSRRESRTSDVITTIVIGAEGHKVVSCGDDVGKGLDKAAWVDGEAEKHSVASLPQASGMLLCKRDRATIRTRQLVP